MISEAELIEIERATVKLLDVVDNTCHAIAQAIEEGCATQGATDPIDASVEAYAQSIHHLVDEYRALRFCAFGTVQTAGTVNRPSPDSPERVEGAE